MNKRDIVVKILWALVLLLRSYHKLIESKLLSETAVLFYLNQYKAL